MADKKKKEDLENKADGEWGPNDEFENRVEFQEAMEDEMETFWEEEDPEFHKLLQKVKGADEETTEGD